MTTPVPPVERALDASGVRALLAAQCPRFGGEAIRLVDAGWDNFIFRLGREHAVRLPRRQAAVDFLLNEQRWLGQLSARLPIAVPTTVHAGVPGAGFPWPWSVVPWIPGTTAEEHRFGPQDALELAEVLLALHREAPAEAPSNPFRGVPLATRGELVAARLARLRAQPGIDQPRLRTLWGEACAAPLATDRRWLHGDLHPRNVVVRDGSLAGLIDWGDLSAGDVATDLACAWLLLDSPLDRQSFFTTYGASEAEVCRAMGWATHLGLALVDSGDARHVAMGLAALGRVGAGRRTAR